jgi:hypothetical protein
VLVAGGRTDKGITNSVELYDPTTELWTITNPLASARASHRAVLLLNGKVLVFGGVGANALSLASAEVYDPVTGTWSSAGSFSTGRYNPAAALLPNGKVLAIGGYNYSVFFNGITNLVDVYDPNIGFKAAWQPQIGTFTSPVSSGGVLTMTGSGLRGVSGASGGNATQDSSSDCPIVQIRSLETGITLFPSSTSWSANFLVSGPVTGFPAGYALLMVFVNGIPSASSLLGVGLPAIILTHPQRLGGGGFQFSFSNVTGEGFTALASTNLLVPTSNWTILGAVTEISPGQFQFTDAQAANFSRRFYRVRSP